MASSIDRASVAAFGLGLGAAAASFALVRSCRPSTTSSDRTATAHTSSSSCSSSSAPSSVDKAWEREQQNRHAWRAQATDREAAPAADTGWPITRDNEVALVDAELRAVVRAGALDIPRLDASDGDASHVQPASIDLPVGSADTDADADAATGSGSGDAVGEHDRVFVMKRKVLPVGRRLEALLQGSGAGAGDGDGGLVLEERSLAGDGCVLLKGQTYVVRCGEVQLPSGHWGRLSPKSSIGRVDLMVRAVLDGCGLYDQVPPDGQRRTLWLELTPQSFNVRLRRGVALTQMMVLRQKRGAELPSAFDPATGTWGGYNMSHQGTLGTLGQSASAHASDGTPTKASQAEDANANAVAGADAGADASADARDAPSPSASPPPEAPPSTPTPPQPPTDGSKGCVVFDQHGEPKRSLSGTEGGQTHNGAIVLSLSVPAFSPGAATGPLIGFEALPTNEIIDLAKPGAHDAGDFFRPIHACSRRPYLTLEKDHFYILCTKERVSVPNALSAEMVPFSHNVGELRAHYAGFFDPGFGYGRSGEVRGTIGVLEVRPHETISIYDGQPICLMEFFRNSVCPEKPYGFTGNNNYARQTGPKLAKYFR